MGKKQKRENTKWNEKVSKPLRLLGCGGCTTTMSCATEALKHVAKHLSAVPCSHPAVIVIVIIINEFHCDCKS